MSRTLMIALLSASLIFFCLSCRESQKPSTEAQKSPATITIEFEGLMVFHQKADKTYEVGILIPEAAMGHELKVFYVNPPKNFVEVRVDNFKADEWVLDVENGSQSTTANIKDKEGTIDRHHDSDTTKENFNWMLDLETDFHHKNLDLKLNEKGEKQLKPVINLRNGTLYTVFKTSSLDYWPDGGKPPELGSVADKHPEFGFVAETTGLDITLQEGEELVLKVKGAGQDGEMFRLKYGQPYLVMIRNVGPPEKPYEQAHFKHYYELFNNVSSEEQYSIEQHKELGQTKPSLNPHPYLKMVRDLKMASDFEKTCCGELCGPIKLGMRRSEKPLTEIP